MAWLPNTTYETRIAGVVANEDNDGNPEIHVHVKQPREENTLAYKIKLRTKEQVVKGRDFLTSFGVDWRKLSSATYVDALESELMDRVAFVHTAAWEMNGKTGVYIKRIAPEKFESAQQMIAKKFSKLANGTDTSAPVGEITDDDLPF